jgi:colicin import membrane protein
MRESRADTAYALTLALLLHALLAALVLFGLWWTRPPLSAAGQPVTAEMVDASTLSAETQRALSKPLEAQPVEQPAEPLPQPLPAPHPEEAPVEPQVAAQEPVPEPDNLDQAKVDRDAVSAETAEREQEAKRRQEQIDLTERQRQEEAEQKQRLAQQQLDDKLKKIQAERAKLARQAELSEQKLKQIADAQARNAAEAAAQADASASAPPGNNGVDAALLARYQAALQEAILRNWSRPDSVPLGQRCRLHIRQVQGGSVIDVQVDASCPYDELGKRSVEAAVLKAQPLPYAGFEAVFSRTLLLNFEAQDR